MPLPRYAPELDLPERPFVPGRDASSDRPVLALAPMAEGVRVEYLAQHVLHRWAIDLFNRGFYWEAHEAWEALWRRLPRSSAESSGLQGLIQCAAAALKAGEQRTAGVERLVMRAIGHLEGARSAASLGLDPIRLAEDMRAYRAAGYTGSVPVLALD